MLSHLIELRQRLLHSVLAVSLIFAVLVYFARPLFNLLASPLLHQLPQGQHLIATSVIAPFFVPLKFAFICALALSMPYLLYQLWQFVAPGLYREEKQLARLMLGLAILLFYSGVTFVYFVVFPLVFRFMQIATPQSVSLLPDMSQYVDFCLQLAFGFGLAFEVPIVVLLLVKCRLVETTTLCQVRPYMIVVAFTLGMLLTPPDVLSQVLLAIPLCLLYELGIVLAKRLSR